MARARLRGLGEPAAHETGRAQHGGRVRRGVDLVEKGVRGFHVVEGAQPILQSGETRREMRGLVAAKEAFEEFGRVAHFLEGDADLVAFLRRLPGEALRFLQEALAQLCEPAGGEIPRAARRAGFRRRRPFPLADRLAKSHEEVRRLRPLHRVAGGAIGFGAAQFDGVEQGVKPRLARERLGRTAGQHVVEDIPVARGAERVGQSPGGVAGGVERRAAHRRVEKPDRGAQPPQRNPHLMHALRRRLGQKGRDIGLVMVERRGEDADGRILHRVGAQQFHGTGFLRGRGRRRRLRHDAQTRAGAGSSLIGSAHAFHPGQSPRWRFPLGPRDGHNQARDARRASGGP